MARIVLATDQAGAARLTSLARRQCLLRELTVSIQGQEGFDYEWLTPRRVRVLRELETEATEKEAADHLQVTYEAVRSAVEELKEKLEVRSVRELRQWWRAHREGWLAWCARQAGISRG